MTLKKKDKLVAIVGPTASGKSELAVRLAKKFNGEVISADSRQVYRGLDIGSGKVLCDKKARKQESKKADYFYKGIRHHLLDAASPKRKFTVVRYQRLARKALRDILKRGLLPIIAGGTGFYVDTLLSGQMFPDVSPQPNLRRRFGKESTEDLYHQLVLLDPDRASNIDSKNRARLVRALEIVITSGKAVPAVTNIWKSDFQILKIGLRVERDELQERIGKRLRERLKEGMIEEVRDLHEKEGVSWKRLDELGLEYRYVSRYLREQLSHDEMVRELEREINRYAKRQMTWFRRDKSTKWIDFTDYKKAESLMKSFMNLQHFSHDRGKSVAFLTAQCVQNEP